MNNTIQIIESNPIINLTIIETGDTTTLMVSQQSGYDKFVTGGTYDNSTGIATFTNNFGETFSVTGFYTNATEPDIFVTGGTYDISTETATFTNNSGGTFSVTGFSGTDTYVTGGTHNQASGITTFTNNSGNTFDVSGYLKNSDIVVFDTFVTGGTHDKNAGITTFTNNSGNTFNVSGYINTNDIPFDTYVTGGTYSNGIATFTNNAGGTFNTPGFFNPIGQSWQFLKGDGSYDNIAYAQDTSVVHNNGNEYIYGIKSFDALPQSNVDPTTEADLTTKKYVDDAVATGIVTVSDTGALYFQKNQTTPGIFDLEPDTLPDDIYTFTLAGIGANQRTLLYTIGTKGDTAITINPGRLTSSVFMAINTTSSMITYEMEVIKRDVSSVDTLIVVARVDTMSINVNTPINFVIANPSVINIGIGEKLILKFYMTSPQTNKTVTAKWGGSESGYTYDSHFGYPVIIDKYYIGLGNVQNVDQTNPANIVQDANHRFLTDFPQTILGNKTISADIVANRVIRLGGNANQFLKADGSVDNNSYLTGYTETSTLQNVTARGNSTTTPITAVSFIKSGGLSTQFLKADGSTDSNSYLTSYTETDTLQTVTNRGSSTTQNITAAKFIKSGGLSTQFLMADGSVSTGGTGSASFTGTTNYLQKLDSNKNLIDSIINGSGLGIGIATTADTTTATTISIGNQNNRSIGIDDSGNGVNGRDLTIRAGRATNVGVVMGNLLPLGLGVYPWYCVGVNQNNGDVYVANDTQGILKQTGGTGSFVALPDPARQYRGIAINSITNDVFVCDYGGGVWKQSGGQGTFNSLGLASKQWVGIAVNPNNNDLYLCAWNDYIYRQVGGTGALVQMGFASTWNGIAINNATGDVYCCNPVTNKDIWKQTAGSGSFVGLSAGSRAWAGIYFNQLTKDIYAVDQGGDIYKSTSNGPFVALGQTFRTWTDVWVKEATGDVYASAHQSDIYKSASGTGSFDNIGGNLVLKAGTGKGAGTSQIQFITGQKTASGFNMQVENVRMIIDENGNTTFNGNIIKSGGTSSQFLMADGSVSSGIALTGTTNIIQKLDANKNLTNSSLTDTGSLISSPIDLSFADTKGFVLTRAGLNRDLRIYNNSTSDNFGSLYVYPNAGTNVSTGFMFIPKGAGLTSTFKVQLGLFNTDYVADINNYEYFSIITQGTNGYLILGDKNGTGVLRPMVLTTNNPTYPNQLRLLPSGNILINSASDNGVDRLQVTGSIIATSIKKSGGLSTQYLMADGSVSTSTGIGGSGTINFIPKFSGTTTTLSNSRILDNGTYLGIDTQQTLTGDLMFGYLPANRTIGIEDSVSSTIGKDLIIKAGRTSNVGGISFYSLSAGSKTWIGISVNQTNNDVYAAVASGDIYKSVSGGTFNPLSQVNRGWQGIAINNSTKDVYAIVYNGSIYKQTAGTGDFIDLVQTTRGWADIEVNQTTGDVYACVQNGDIYKMTGGAGNFVALGLPTKQWQSIAVNSNNNDIYIGVLNGDIWKLPSGTGSLVPTGSISNDWMGIAVNTSTNDVYAVSKANGLYRQINSSGVFTFYMTVATNQFDITVNSISSDIYVGCAPGDIYKTTTTAGPADLNGGVLQLKGGIAKGAGQSRIQLITGQKTASGTNMQVETVRVLIDENGNTTFNGNIIKSGGTSNQFLIADGSTTTNVATYDNVDLLEQIEVGVSGSVLEAWKGRIVLFTSSCTITVPATLSTNFSFQGVTLAGVTITWAITAPKTWLFGTTPSTAEKSTFSLMQRGSTNSIIYLG